MLPMSVQTHTRNPRRDLVSTLVDSWANFSPLSLAPAMWFDASDTSTITSSSGAVSQIDDKSGNGNHAKQATASLQPTTGSTTQNGLNVLSFSTNRLDVTYSITANRISVVAVALKTAAGASTQKYSRVCSAWNTADNAQNVGDFGNTNGCIFVHYANATYGGFTPASACYRNGASPAAFLYTYNTASITTFTMSGGGVKYRHNGSETTGSTSTTAMNFNQLLLGNAPFSTGDSSLNGWIAEVVVVPRTLNSVEITLIERYLKNKWATV